MAALATRTKDSGSSESNNITLVFLVPDSSHLTQPLDLVVFGLVKRALRDSATYALNVEELNDALDDALDGLAPDPPVLPQVRSGSPI